MAQIEALDPAGVPVVHLTPRPKAVDRRAQAQPYPRRR